MSLGCYSTIQKSLLSSQSICLPLRYCGRLQWSLAQILASDQLVPTVTSLSSETVHLFLQNLLLTILMLAQLLVLPLFLNRL
jgi:hypothetical protein